jgi:RNase P subunit RPR2
MVCQRCRGLLVRETFNDLSIESNSVNTATRCINCGYIEDAVVRANRVRALVSTQATPRGMVGMGDVGRIEIHPKTYALIR